MRLLRLGVLVLLVANPAARAQESAAPLSRDEFLARLAELCKSAPAPEVPHGDRSISGRIVTDVGAPLAGVVIRATQRLDSASGPYSRPIVEEAPKVGASQLVDSLRSTLDWWYRNQGSAHEAISDADGRYAFSDLVEGRYQLQAYARGFEVAPPGDTNFGSVEAVTGAIADFVATPVESLRFEVLRADGTPVKEATIVCERLTRSGRPRPVSWTPEAPTLRLAAGDWYVTARVGGLHNYETDPGKSWFASGRNLVTIVPGREPPPVTLTMKGVPAIEGAIRSAIAGFQPSVQVYGVRLQPGQEPDPTLLVEDPRQRGRPPNPGGASKKAAQIQSGSSRGTEYRIDGIAPGRWYLGVTASGKSGLLAAIVVEVGEGCVTHDFFLALPDPDAIDSVVVRVLEPDGAPLRDCLFFHRTYQRPPAGFPNSVMDRMESWGGSSGPIQGERTGDGAFRFDRARMPERTFLIASHPRFGMEVLEIVGGQSRYEIRFAEPIAATLRMPGFAEHAGKRAVSLSLERLGSPVFKDNPTRFAADAIAADGSVVLGSLQPGSYRLHLFADPDLDDNVSAFEVASQPLELATGPRELTLPFPKLEELRIAYPAGTRGMFSLSPIDASPDDNRGVCRSAEVDGEGIAHFKDVPPGRYRIDGPNQEFMVVAAPIGGLLRFTPSALNAQCVVITDREGGFAKAGLQDGDWVVAYGGREFANRQELDQARSQALERRQPGVTLTLQRADERFEVVLSPVLLSDHNKAGGYFFDASR